MSQRSLSRVHDAAWEARDHYRWLLLTGWFVLISTVFPFVISMAPRIQPASGIPLVMAAIALAAYNIAIKRYWPIALGLLSLVIAVAGWAVIR